MIKKIMICMSFVIFLNSCGYLAIAYAGIGMACAMGEYDCEARESTKKPSKKSSDGVRNALLDGQDERYLIEVRYRDKENLKIAPEASLLVPKNFILQKSAKKEKIGLLTSDYYLYDKSKNFGFPVGIKIANFTEKARLESIINNTDAEYVKESGNMFVSKNEEEKKYYLKKLGNNVFISYEYSLDMQNREVQELINELSKSW